MKDSFLRVETKDVQEAKNYESQYLMLFSVFLSLGSVHY